MSGVSTLDHCPHQRPQNCHLRSCHETCRWAQLLRCSAALVPFPRWWRCWWGWGTQNVRSVRIIMHRLSNCLGWTWMHWGMLRSLTSAASFHPTPLARAPPPTTQLSFKEIFLSLKKSYIYQHNYCYLYSSLCCVDPHFSYCVPSTCKISPNISCSVVCWKWIFTTFEHLKSISSTI